jgi:hypothetical protein
LYFGINSGNCQEKKRGIFAKLIICPKAIIQLPIISFYTMLSNLSIAKLAKIIVKIILPRIVLSSAIAVILFPAVIYSGLILRRPPRTAQQEKLFPGINYQRIADLNPRPVMMHLVTIDLTAPGIKLRVTPGEPGDDGKDIPAQTTSEFLQKHQLQLAINGSFFYPCYFNHF